MNPADIGVFVVGALGVLAFLFYVHTLRCPKCRRFEIVDYGKYCRFCGDDLDTITGSFNWIARIPLFVLPLVAATVVPSLLFDRPQYAFWSFGIMFVVLLLRNIVLRVAFGCDNCGASQLVTRRNFMAQKHCSHCGERI
ncbi:MAG: hypothetical protein FD180_2408 [Planctomycetota bacterium]|nr:MAG: hypothetical protein FD180_2408 [Planctomycetota bacterium]